MRRLRRTMNAGAFALIAALAGCSPGADAPPPPPAATLENASLMAKAEARGMVRIIARMAPQVTPAIGPGQQNALAFISAAGATQAAALGADLPFVVAEVTPGQLGAIVASGQFDWIAEDRLARPVLAASGPLVGAPAVWERGGRGAGAAVAILDTGVDTAHPFLGGRVVAEACFSTSSAAMGAQSVCPSGQTIQTGAGAARPCKAAGCEHGTHVAGIAAGAGQAFSGMAPDTRIVAVQVFSQFADSGASTPCRDSGQPSPCIASFTSDQIRGLDFVRQIAGQWNIAAANMSLGGGRFTGACDNDLTKGVIDQLRAVRVTTVIASGNDGFADAVSAPGCITSAMTVGASTLGDGVARFSNRGPQVDVLAPGENINSSVPNAGFARFSGTSMATPHVAGALAALRSLRPDAPLVEGERAVAFSGPKIGGVSRLAMKDAADRLAAAPVAAVPPQQETPLATAASADGDPALTRVELESLPADRPLRVLVSVRTPANATEAAVKGAVELCVEDAQAAGASLADPVAGQPIVVVEATPPQLAKLARSRAVLSIQPEGVARTQK